MSAPAKVTMPKLRSESITSNFTIMLNGGLDGIRVRKITTNIGAIKGVGAPEYCK